jgi:hypothetical protein
MHTIQKNLVRAGTVNNRADNAQIFENKSQSPLFAKKIFCGSQSFSQNIKSWEGPVKSCFSLEFSPLTDW